MRNSASNIDDIMSAALGLSVTDIQQNSLTCSLRLATRTKQIFEWIPRLDAMNNV